MKEFIKKHSLIIFIVIVSLIRLALTANIPIVGWGSQISDDKLMLNMAVDIRAGNWLGDYTSDILVKGPSFPFLLALINFFGLSYINVMNIIYILSCAFFLYTIKDLFKTKKALAIIYLLLIFNPVSYACWTLQRIYRNGITLSQVLIIIGSMFALYQRRDMQAKKILPFAIIGGLALASLWLTREDGIWILPFVLIVTLIVMACIVFKNKRINLNKNSISKVLIALLPIVILFVSLHTVRIINYNSYGIYAYNEINDGYFGKVIKTMYSIKTDEDIQYVTVTKNKIKLMCENSETLKKVEPKLEKVMSGWDMFDRNPGDGQVEDGWFWWALKNTVEDEGYYKDAKTSNEFYKNVYNELQNAIKEGKLKTGISMPATLMSPWKTKYFAELPVSMLRMSWFIANFENVNTSNSPSEPNSTMFNVMTNDQSVPTDNEDLAKYTKKYVDRLNNITWVYQKTGVILTIASIVGYIFITITFIKNRKEQEVLDVWLLLTGIGCSLLVLIAGVAYNHITACDSKNYMYLSGAYPLLIAFWGISICKMAEIVNCKVKNKVKNGGKVK